MDNDVLQLCEQLIAVESITPHDHHCQNILIERLEKIGFDITRLPSDPVSNFWAQRGNTKPLFAFAGHTDVVAPGDTAQWNTPPFTASTHDGLITGRGVADMKGALAAMIIATERFVSEYPQHEGSIGFLITSGEEGDHFHLGTPHVMQHLAEQGIHIDYCLVGEPSCTTHIGDTIKNGRRGSLTAKLTINGKQGHVAYPHLADNPIHNALAALDNIAQYQWDDGDEYFAPSSLQFTNLRAGDGMGNVIPGDMFAEFNIRYCPKINAEHIKQTVAQLLDNNQCQYTITWRLNGEPFITPASSPLITALEHCIAEHTSQESQLSTSGGTSDARFIAPFGVDVIEFGLCNATIHQVNEHARTSDLALLTEIYYRILCSFHVT